MPFIKCAATDNRINPYCPLFFTFGPLPKVWQQDDERRKAFEDKMRATAKVHFGNMKDEPYFCVFEMSDGEYYHAHQMIATTKRTTKWLSYCNKIKDQLRLLPDSDPEERRLPNACAHHCQAGKHESATQIMTNYVTFSNKGKNIGSGDIRLDPLGPEPIRPLLDFPQGRSLTSMPTGLLWMQWLKFYGDRRRWKDVKFHLNIAKQYKSDYAFILSEPKHPHYAFHKATLARKEAWVQNYILLQTTPRN